MRKLHDGTEFKIGKSFVRIRNKSTKLSLTVPKDELSVDGVTTPKMITDYIKDGRISKNHSRYFNSCIHSNRDRELKENPFLSEIYGKIEYIFICKECYDKMADEI